MINNLCELNPTAYIAFRCHIRYHVSIKFTWIIQLDSWRDVIKVLHNSNKLILLNRNNLFYQFKKFFEFIISKTNFMYLKIAFLNILMNLHIIILFSKI